MKFISQMISLKKYWILLIVIILALFLRIYKLDSYPALNADEAAIGYNAYSLIETGMDEHGHKLPIHFQSFNDYKPGLYFYLVLPFVKLLGLNEWAVRLPNALLGVATVFVIYFLATELFKNSQNSIRRMLPIASAFFLAISPWHIHFSRGGWEVNVATFLITLGVYLFLKALGKPSALSFGISLLPLVLSLYTYHSARVIVPLLAMGSLIVYRKELFTVKNFKSLVLASLFALLLLLPLGRDMLKGSVLSRAAGVGLFADSGPLNRINEQRGEHANLRSFSTKLFHNKPVNYGLAFLENWKDHFQGEFLFLTGDVIQRNKVPETGQMYLIDILFLTLGFVFIFRNYAFNRKSFFIILWWLVIAPVAAALTFQAPHALRSENMVIPLVIISALGFTHLLDWLKVKNLKVGVWILAIIITWLFIRYEHMYWVHMSKEYPFSSQYGVKELTSYLNGNVDRFDSVIVTDRYDQPYILFLFYLKYDPQEFQFKHTLTSKDTYGFSTVREFDKFNFESINFNEMRTRFPKSLIIGTPTEIPKEANVVERIYGTNGYEYFAIVAN